MSSRPRRVVEAVTGYARGVRPSKKDLRDGAVSGLPGAISSVPDGMASSILAGVNPIHGLNASFAGPIAGGLAADTRLMVITTTSAGALAAGSAVSGFDAQDRPEALFLLTLLAGVAMVAAGVLRLGRYTRFVTHSVMVGFLTGVAINILLGQLGDLLGVDASGSIALSKAIDVLSHPGEWSITSLATGVGALGLLALLGRTRVGPFSTLIALIIPTIVVALFDVGGVAKVSDAGDIPRGLHLPEVPDLGMMSFSLVTGALAVAAIVLVQGAGVAQSAPNPDGSASNPNTDFIAQGSANVVSSFFKGMPVGGSVGQTALSIAAGARTRWAAILSGVWMLVILAAFSGLVGKVAVPTLAAVLIFAAVGAIRIPDALAILRTGPTSQVAMIATFLATLFLPVAAAVGIGVVLALLLQLNQEALDLKLVELYRTPQGAIVERPAPSSLTSGAVVVLDVYGSLFYAGARTLEARLPDPAGTQSPAVVLRLRGRTTLGATSFEVLAKYAERLHAVGGRLVLSGLDEEVVDQLRRNRRGSLDGTVEVVPATDVLMESTILGLDRATSWVVEHRPPDPAAER